MYFEIKYFLDRPGNTILQCFHFVKISRCICSDKNHSLLKLATQVLAKKKKKWKISVGGMILFPAKFWMGFMKHNKTWKLSRFGSHLKDSFQVMPLCSLIVPLLEFQCFSSSSIKMKGNIWIFNNKKLPFSIS